jgi:hypothetical protein
MTPDERAEAAFHASLKPATKSHAVKAIADAIRAAVAEAEAARWRPIETAPKTGDDLIAKPILAYCPDESPGDRIRLIWWEPKLRGGIWYDDGETRGLRPTHWLPLPAPPGH